MVVRLSTQRVWHTFNYDVTVSNGVNLCHPRVAGCPLFRGCLSIEVNERAVRTFIFVRYIVGVRYSGVSVKRGSTVVYTKCISI